MEYKTLKPKHHAVCADGADEARSGFSCFFCLLDSLSVYAHYVHRLQLKRHFHFSPVKSTDYCANPLNNWQNGIKNVSSMKAICGVAFGNSSANPMQTIKLCREPHGKIGMNVLFGIWYIQCWISTCNMLIYEFCTSCKMTTARSPIEKR